jgi:hypothetical protein
LFGFPILACVYANEVTKPLLHYSNKFVAFCFLSAIFVMGIVFHPLLILIFLSSLALTIAFSPIWILSIITKHLKNRRDARLREMNQNLL